MRPDCGRGIGGRGAGVSLAAPAAVTCAPLIGVHGGAMEPGLAEATVKRGGCGDFCNLTQWRRTMELAFCERAPREARQWNRLSLARKAGPANDLKCVPGGNVFDPGDEQIARPDPYLCARGDGREGQTLRAWFSPTNGAGGGPVPGATERRWRGACDRGAGAEEMVGGR